MGTIILDLFEQWNNLWDEPYYFEKDEMDLFISEGKLATQFFWNYLLIQVNDPLARELIDDENSNLT